MDLTSRRSEIGVFSYSTMVCAECCVVCSSPCSSKDQIYFMFKVETKLCFELLMGYLICNLKFNREKCGQKIQQEPERSRVTNTVVYNGYGIWTKRKVLWRWGQSHSAIPDFQPWRSEAWQLTLLSTQYKDPGFSKLKLDFFTVSKKKKKIDLFALESHPCSLSLHGFLVGLTFGVLLV